jgi:RNA polymerase sigma-70 factor (ECF subfamily)
MESSTHFLQRPFESEAARNDAVALAQSVSTPDAFSVVYRRHVRAIHIFVAARLGPVQAEDVVADVFAAAFAARATFDKSATDARPWLYGIATNKLRQHRAAEARWLRQPHREEDVPDELGARSDERLDAHALAPELAAALACLTPAERDALVLFILEDLTHGEIAKALGIHRGTAKVRLHRGRKRLREALEQRHKEQSPA